MRTPHLTVHPLSSSQREIWFDQMLEMFRTAVQMLAWNQTEQDLPAGSDP